MRRVPLARRPAVTLSRLAFGGAPVGNLYRPVDDAQAIDAVEAAWSAGIRYFDTAPHYGLGLSERRLGAALAHHDRAEVVVSTKVGRILVPTPDRAAEQDSDGFVVPRTHERAWDFSADGVRRSLEASLERLGLDRVDLVLVHDPDDHLPQALDEAVPALCALRDEGVVGAVGVGMNQSAGLTRFVRESDVDAVMCAGRYSLLEQPALDDLLPAALEHRVGVIAVGVFNSGLLARADVPSTATYDYGPAPQAALRRARALAAVCREHDTTLPAAAVHVALAHPAVISVGLGMASREQVGEDVDLLDSPPPPELWADLVARGLLGSGVPVPC